MDVENNNYAGKWKWLTEWLEEEERFSDTWPYSVTLFVWTTAGGEPIWNNPKGYLAEHDARTYFRATMVNIRSEAKRITPHTKRAAVVLFRNGQVLQKEMVEV